MISPIPDSVRNALSKPSDIPGHLARGLEEKPFSGQRRGRSSINPHEVGARSRIVSPESIRWEQNLRNFGQQSRVSVSEINPTGFENSSFDIETQFNSFSGFLDRLGVDSDELQISLNNKDSHKDKKTALLNHTYSVLGTEVGRNSFIDGLQKLNRPTLERVSDLKANAFDELGLGLARNVIAEKHLGEVTRSLVKDINQVANSRLFDGASVQQQINEIIASYQEKHDIDPKTLANLGLVVATAVGAAAAYKGRKYLPAALIVLGSVLNACQPPGQQANPEDYLNSLTADMANEAAQDWLDVYIETEDPNDPQKVYIFDVEYIDWKEREGSN